MVCLIYTVISILAALFVCGANAGDTFFFNETSFMQVTTATIPLKQGFDLTFRTCQGGVLLYQGGHGDDYVLLRVSPGTINYNISVSPPYFTPSRLTLQWKVHGVESSIHAGNELDKNYLNTVTFDPGSSSVNATIKIVGPNSYSAVVPEDIFNFTRSGPMYAGGNLSHTSSIKGFVGCIESGRNIPLIMSQGATNVQAGCPLDSQVGCTRKKCDSGFTGYYCEVNINECSGNPCHSFSTCDDGINSYKCICGSQWTGKNCDTFLGSLCDAKPCKNGGVCKESFDRNNYTCTCPAGWTGRNCDSSFNPCDLSPCFNDGSCYRDGNTSNGFNCTCHRGFTGIKCETNINDCASLQCANGKCVDGVNNFTCNCTGSGYTGPTCSDNINECASSPCLNNATCHDYIGTYACRCVRGFDGKHCENKIDECSPNPCVNGDASCMNGGTFQNTIGSYVCACNEFTNGTRCELDIDECENKTICNTGLCVNKQYTGYDCYCKPGWTGDNCYENINECGHKGNPCKNGATCVDGMNKYTCVCTSGWEGKDCDQDIDECALGYCKNGAECNIGNDTYSCTCVPGYTDHNCSTDINECASKPCYNGATCNNHVNYFSCTCVPGYTGYNCSIEIDECASNPCQNNATCSDLINDVNCSCPANYTGRLCEYTGFRCRPNNPCNNNGTCLDQGLDNYKCSCIPGFGGKNCENSTTISMDGSSYMAFNVGKSILTISLQFRTILKYGVLVIDSGGKLLIQLKGGLLVSYDIENRTVGSNANLTDGHWHQVLVNLTSTSIQINIDNSFYSDCTKTISRSSNDVLSKLFIGGATNNKNMKLLIGCIRAVEVDGLTVIPTQSDVQLVNVTNGCPRVPVCQPNPCVNGRCIDEWLDYKCECNRPWTGDQCNKNSATYVYLVWIVLLVIVIIILLVIVLKQRKEIAFHCRKSTKPSDPRVFHSPDPQPEQVDHNEAISLESLRSSSTPANDDYEQIDQIVTDHHQLPNTHTHTTTPTTYVNTEHVSNSDTAEQTSDSNELSYYNAAHDAEDTTAVQQSRDMLDLSASHVEVPVQNHYQELVSSGKSSGQGVYQELSPDTRQEDRTKGPGNYASLRGFAVQEYQGLVRSVQFDINDLNECNA